jgi:hypothetical protein
MALHRDIYWVGRQWAVTGFGVQAVDQRLKGAFDIEIARLWDDDLPQRMRALAWLRADDFEKALTIARSRFPEPPRKSLPLIESVLELISPVAGEPPNQGVKQEVKPASKPHVAQSELRSPAREPLKPAVVPIDIGPSSGEPPKPVASLVQASQPANEPAAINLSPPRPQPLALRIERVSAKFLPRWRVRQ